MCCSSSRPVVLVYYTRLSIILLLVACVGKSAIYLIWQFIINHCQPAFMKLHQKKHILTLPKDVHLFYLQFYKSSLVDWFVIHQRQIIIYHSPLYFEFITIHQREPVKFSFQALIIYLVVPLLSIHYVQHISLRTKRSEKINKKILITSDNYRIISELRVSLLN